MKRWCIFLLVSISLLLLLAGCFDRSANMSKQSFDPTDTTASVTMGRDTQSVSDSVASATNGKETQSDLSPTGNKATESVQISREDAQRIALEKARVTVDQIFDYECELDYDDDSRIWEYEISFRVGRVEYDCDINAQDGTVIRFESDYDD